MPMSSSGYPLIMALCLLSSILWEECLEHQRYQILHKGLQSSHYKYGHRTNGKYDWRSKGGHDDNVQLNKEYQQGDKNYNKESNENFGTEISDHFQRQFLSLVCFSFFLVSLHAL